jgi:hypothetical protein
VILIYCRPAENAECLTIVARLEAEGEKAAIRNVRYYAGEVERDVNKRPVREVLYTERALDVVEPYERAGIPTTPLFDSREPVLPPDPPPSAPVPMRELTLAELPWLPPGGYTLKREGPWWKAFGPAGLKVGKARRSEEEARGEAWQHHNDPDPYETARRDREVRDGRND